MAKLQPNVTPPLASLYVYATNRCNCSCKHCWIVPETSEARGPAHFLPPDLFEAAVAEAKPLGLTSVKWTGGEPTIHPEFPRLLALQKAHGLRGSMETNGLEVSAALARLLADSGTTHVSVSLDGARPETHDAIRGVRGAHRRALAGVRHLREAGLPPQLIMTLMAENAGELEALLDLAREVGASSVKLNIVQPTLRGEELQAAGQGLGIRELLAINRRIEEIRVSYPFPIHYDLPMAFRSIKHIVAGDGCSVCGIWTILGLLADGHYALCGIGQNVAELVFGPAGQGELERIWREHPVLVELRQRLPDELEGICGRCIMRNACLGSCVAQNYYRRHSLLAPYWLCELAEQEGLFPQTRLRSEGDIADA